MGLRCVVGTESEPPKPFRLRVRSGHERRPGRIDGRLRLGRRGSRVPGLRSSDDDDRAAVRPLRPHIICIFCLLVVSLVDDWRRVGRRCCVAQSAGFVTGLRPGCSESVCGRRLLDLLRWTAVITGDRVGRLRGGLGFASLRGDRK